jgi:glycosyltransferase involved in cell wall biosynthesis
MKISLIITVLNSAKYVAKAIESFISQDYDNKELIILDANSTDGSHEIIESYQKKYPNLIKWIKEDDSGISNARNKALKHVSGDIIGFLGADDILYKDFYKNLVYHASICDDFDVLYFNYYSVGKGDFTFTLASKIKATKRNFLKFAPIASGESFYYKKTVFDKFSFNEKNRFSMDYELNLALSSSKKYQFFPVNISAVFNGSFGDSISSSMPRKQRLETIAVQLKYADTFKEKFLIIFRKKKFILNNLKDFLEIRKNI